MNLHSPTVGPIIGYTTANQVRIWLRGDFQEVPGGYRRGFGVARVAERKAGAPQWSAPKFVKLPAYFDMTGICVVPGLKPDTDYLYEAGWFFADMDLDKLDTLDGAILDWSGAANGSFRTGVDDSQRARSYVVGSCRYLLKLFGGRIFDERGDKAFGSILRQIEQGRRVDGLMMVGDQIYADDLNFLAPDTRLDQFFTRYRESFSQPCISKLMSQVPTYMVLDDHEIEDNWPNKADDKDRVTLYPNAMHAYQVYQCSHSPLFETDARARITNTPDKFWYTFRDGCCDWFVMDVRTERVWDTDPSKRSMLKPSQMNALKAWLVDGSGCAKFIVSSVPVFPDVSADNDDKWGAYQRERTEILDYILANKVRKVAFLSGDVHCSFSVELTSPDDPQFKVISIISSSFFWPYPHMHEGDFLLSGELQAASGNTYMVGAASKLHSTDNFSRVTVDSTGVDIEFFERKGDQLDKTRRQF